jgi:PucR C-terminal helix-turn-helix domain/GGDEF-like domain
MRIEEVRRGLTDALRSRREEIEQATLARVRGVADVNENPESEYAEGLRSVVSAALDYGIEAIERSEDLPPPMPTVLLSQARLAARHGIALNTVLRRYVAGYTLLGDFVIEESERAGPLDGASLKRLLRVLAALLDRVIAAVSEEYAREMRTRPRSAEQRLAERIEQLLEGQRLDTSELPYDFDAIHVALIAKGPGAEEAIRQLADPLDRRLLLVCRGEAGVWAWLGGRRVFDPEELRGPQAAALPATVSVAIGEAGEGLDGWRLSHRQARAALSVAIRGPEPLVRYVDVALLASMLRDDLLATSLGAIYLEPLAAERDGGKVLRQTLGAYFACERNSASAAAALGVTRQTVNNRLRAIEARIGRPLNACVSELEAALRLDRLAFLAVKSPTPAFTTSTRQCHTQLGRLAR